VNGLVRQTRIYLDGVSGRRPHVPVDQEALAAAAAEVLRPEAHAYIAAGAGAERTVRANRAAFDAWRIVPRMLRDVGVRDTSVELFGRRMDTPLMLAPIGVLELAHRHADLAVARAARTTGTTMVLSNQASHPMERVVAELGDSPRWFQLYWSRSDELVASLVSRAEAAGCEAIVVTLDTTLLGWRTRDLDQAYLPFLRGKGIAQYTSDPVFNRIVAEPPPADAPERPDPKPTLAALRTLLELRRSGASRAQVQRFVEIYSRPTLTWEHLSFLRERTKLPILLKGILHPDDARRALEVGMDGIVVSNHGGRQVDGGVATLAALPGIVDAVGGRAPVLLDSGVRSGADIVKALALGARAVLIGRPYVYGLALAGETGVREVLENLAADFDLTLGLAGRASVAELGPETLAPGGTL
jgi:isopentenyl diphosphate isomerase/L-lactate dehydrogenase-like FMN-dependent dehydrogenase